MLGKTVGWWVALVAVSGATMGCNAILGWEQSWDAGPAPSCEGEGTDGCTGEVNDCCDSLVVAGKQADKCDERIEGFMLDAYEVTVGRFNVFVDAPNGYATAKPPSGWPADKWVNNMSELRAVLKQDGCTMDKGDTLPMNCVTWAEADAFCKWDGGRLPTVGEFERAAEFPWLTSGVDESRAVFGKSKSSAVGLKPDGRSVAGHFDLLGNVQEWTKLNNPKECPGVADFNATEQPCFGGSFLMSASDLSSGILQEPVAPNVRNATTGFRCARNP